MENIESMSIIKNKNSILKTYINGFDDLFYEKGIPQNTSILISGPTGSGKSIFCRQISYNILKNGGKCFYISFQESDKGIKRSMEKFGWNVNQYINCGSFIIQKINPLDILRMKFGSVGGSGSATEVSYKIKPFEIPKDFNPDIIVIDSFSSIIEVSTTKEKNFRVYLQQLFEFFEESNSISFLISETFNNNQKYSNSGIEEFLADGVVKLYNFNNKFDRAIEIIKMRYSKHSKNIVKMIINENGIEIFPNQIIKDL
jgi:KaiC/GvpD/RAD55 family RecA-like ATPase